MNLKEIHLRALEPEDIEILEKIENNSDYWSYSNQTEPFSRHILPQFINQQKKDFIRLGVLGDWENPYLSLNKSFEADTVRALGRIIANGHLEKGEKPVHFCMDCGSALAEAEVEYKDKKSHSIDVKFKVKPESIESLCAAIKTKKIN